MNSPGDRRTRKTCSGVRRQTQFFYFGALMHANEQFDNGHHPTRHESDVCNLFLLGRLGQSPFDLDLDAFVAKVSCLFLFRNNPALETVRPFNLR
jgi:hypothetical protein